MKLDRKEFGGTTNYRVATDTATTQQIDFYHDFDLEESWYIYRVKRLDLSRYVKTLNEAIELWNKQEL